MVVIDVSFCNYSIIVFSQQFDSLYLELVETFIFNKLKRNKLDNSNAY